MKREKLLAYDWSSGCLGTVYAIEMLYSATKVSRFEIVDEEYIEEVKDERE